MSQPVNALQAFAYNAQPVRIVERDGQPWFVLKDVCDVLSIKQPVRVAERLDEDEVSLTHVTDALGRQQETAVVSESGLYAVILRSDKPEAKPFRRWVTAEVLPSIRQHGFYEVPSKLKPKRSGAQPPLGKHYYTSARCNVCNTPHVHRIDQMLSGNVLKQDGKRYSYEEILLWARMQGVTLSKAGLSRHRTEHLLPRLNPQGQDTTRGGVDGVLRRMVRDVVQDVLGEVLGEVQHHARRATQGRSRRTAQTPQEAEPSEDDLEASKPAEPELTSQSAPCPRPTSKVKPGVRRTGKRARPKDFQAALKLEAALNRIQVMPVMTRGTLIRELATSYGVDVRTVQRWMADYQQHGLAGITSLRRSDKGHMRLPSDHVRALSELIEEYPTVSAHKLYSLTKKTRPELLQYPRKNEKEHTISFPSFRKIVYQVRNPIAEEQA